MQNSRRSRILLISFIVACGIAALAISAIKQHQNRLKARMPILSESFAVIEKRFQDACQASPGSKVCT